MIGLLMLEERTDKMRYFIMDSQDIRVNLATEEYLMNTADVSEPLLLFYIQKPSVIIGRYQNAYEEINLDYLREHHVVLTRRISGGGAVYDDLGNLSFSIVMQKDDTTFGDYQRVTMPILKGLQAMGARSAEMGGRNDLYIHGQKFSGNAMYTKKNRTYSHGTLMYDVDLSILESVLTVSKEKFESKATKSVRKSVSNIKPYLDERYQTDTTEEFRDELLCQIYSVSSLNEISDKQLKLTDKDNEEIQKLVDTRYGNDEWIFGETPEFHFNKRTRIPSVGIVDIHVSTNKGIIQELAIYGDFFGEQEIAILQNQLIGEPYIYEVLKKRLQTFSVSDYILNLTNEELLSLLFS